MRQYLFLAFALCLTFPLVAQDCNFQLQLLDTVSGDGWNGSFVTLTVAGVPTTYTLDAMNDDGRSRDFFFSVNDGDQVRVGFTAGAFSEEVSFALLDNDDNEIFSTSDPGEGNNIFRFAARCRDCAPPPASSIELRRLRFNSVEVTFRSTAAAADPLYLIEYGPGDFDPTTDDNGTEVTSRDTTIRIEGLEPNTTYSLWVSTRCGTDGTTSARRGPYTFRTQLQRDLGVTVLRSPSIDCALGSEPVTIGITNFGGEAQAFFNVDFSIDGQPGGVVTPNDGIYTGVVGVDSTEFFTFDVTADLRQPGNYEFAVWTALEGDENPTNDTLRVTVTSVPTVTEFPYLEDFETSAGFWRRERFGRGPASWAWGEPRGEVIDRAGSGRRVIATDLRGDYNNNERSYLRSPCFDFSGMVTDPFLSFLLFVDTEPAFDRLSLESSTDGGQTWQLLDNDPSTVNWYNNFLDQAWDGDGGFGPRYALVGRSLAGLAGEAEVQLRFVFESDGGTTREGVAIDNIRIAERRAVDYAAVTAFSPNETACGDGFSNVTLRYINLGNERPDSITVAYRVFDNPPVRARIATPAPVGRGGEYTFDFTFSASSTEDIPVTAWVEAEGDQFSGNDTTVLIIPSIRELPFLEDFQDGRLPQGWTVDETLTLGSRGASGDSTLYDRLSGPMDAATITTANYGPVAANDTLVFDFDLTPVTAADSAVANLVVDVVVDCAVGGIEPLLDSLMAGSGTYRLPLGQYAGASLRFVLTARYTAGDFFVDFDDISVRRCDGSLDLVTDVVPPSGIFADNATGIVEARAGLPPYTYRWSTGDTTQAVDGLSVATYGVTVTDAVGCQDFTNVVVDFNVATDDPGQLLGGLEVFPNPTDGRLSVRLDLEVAAPVSWELSDATGRRLEHRDFGRNNKLAATLDLGDRPAGVYLLRVVAGDAARTLRILRR